MVPDVPQTGRGLRVRWVTCFGEWQVICVQLASSFTSAASMEGGEWYPYGHHQREIVVTAVTHKEQPGRQQHLSCLIVFYDTVGMVTTVTTVTTISRRSAESRLSIERPGT
jgi:hypothetical protein